MAGKGASTDVEKAFDERVGQNIKRLRLLTGLSQTELARGANVTFQQMQKYERGLNRVAASRLAGIAKTLGVPTSKLLDDGEDLTPDEDGEANVRLMTYLRRCRPEAQKIVFDLVRSLAKA